MAIKKQEFYEGAALHMLARVGGITSIKYEAPFFLLNNELLTLLKYCTKRRSPWGFTFTIAEQVFLQNKADKFTIVIGLICGADGVAALSNQDYLSVAAPRQAAIHIACSRPHGKHYVVSGPDGPLNRKVAPSNWQRILDR